MNTLKRAASIALATAMLALSMPSLAAADFYMRVVNVEPSQRLNVFDCASTDCTVMGTFAWDGEDIYVDYCEDGWCRVSTTDGWGWSSNEYLQDMNIDVD